MDGEPSRLADGEDGVRVLVLREALPDLREVLVVGFDEPVHQVRIGAERDARFQIRDKTGRDLRAVFVADRSGGDDQRGAHFRLLAEASGCQVRAKQEEMDVHCQIVRDDLRDDGEGRVIDDDAVGAVVVAFVVASGVERADHLFAADAVALRDVGLNDLHNVGRGVAVVGRLLRFEFLDEAFVIVELSAGLRVACHQRSVLSRIWT